MISATLKEIEAYKSKIAALEKKVSAERSKELSGLHKKVGFDTLAELIEALVSLDAGAPRKARKPKAKTAKKAAPAPKGAKKRAKRTKITPELKKNIVAAIKAGGTGAAVAAKFGVSVPTLSNIKKEAGLTKARKK